MCVCLTGALVQYIAYHTGHESNLGWRIMEGPICITLTYFGKNRQATLICMVCVFEADIPAPWISRLMPSHLGL